MYIPLLCSLQAYKLPGGAQLARTIYEPYENKYLCMNFVYCVILYAGMRAVQFLYPGRHCDQGIVHVDTRTVGERGRGGGVGRGRRGPEGRGLGQSESESERERFSIMREEGEGEEEEFFSVFLMTVQTSPTPELM